MIDHNLDPEMLCQRIAELDAYQYIMKYGWFDFLPLVEVARSPSQFCRIWNKQGREMPKPQAAAQEIVGNKLCQLRRDHPEFGQRIIDVFKKNQQQMQPTA